MNWSQYRRLIQIEDPDKREYYELESVNNGWTARETERQISSMLYERLLMSNDKESVLAVARKERIPDSPTEIIKDPMVLEFLGLHREASYYEKDLEGAIMSHLTDFLLIFLVLLLDYSEKVVPLHENYRFMKHIQPQQDIPEEIWMKRLIESYRHNQEKLEKLTAYAKALEEENMHLKYVKNVKDDYQRLMNYAKGLEEENALQHEMMEKLGAHGPRIFKENEELRKMLRMSKCVPEALIRTKPLRGRISLLCRYIDDLRETLAVNDIEIPEPSWPYHPLRGIDLDALEETWIKRYLMYCNNSEDK